MTLQTEIKVPLQVPISVKAEDGKEATRAVITIRRPKTVHAKQLAVLIGPKLASNIMSNVSDGTTDVDVAELITELSKTLLTTDALDSLTGIIASMAGETVDFIDELDWLDLAAVGKAVIGFFPALQSLVPSKSPQI